MSLLVPWPFVDACPAWDVGLTWHLEQTSDDLPDLGDDALTLELMRDQHLRASPEDNAYIDWLRAVTYRMAERMTWRSHLPQTWRMVLNGFPGGDGRIVLPRPPLIDVPVITYVDPDGNTETLTGSPEMFQVTAPSGPTAKRGDVRPLFGEQWPATRLVPDAVTVTFTAGYTDGVPTEIDHGRLLVMAEFYKQRSLSVPGTSSKAMVQARDLWMGYRAY